MRRTLIPIAAVLAAVALAACSGTAKPQVSAARACKDFMAWMNSVHANVASAKNIGQLRAAVAEAPSGQLYQDLSTLAGYAGSVDTGSPSGLSAEEAVAQDCTAVNPNQ